MVIHRHPAGHHAAWTVAGSEAHAAFGRAATAVQNLAPFQVGCPKPDRRKDGFPLKSGDLGKPGRNPAAPFALYSQFPGSKIRGVQLFGDKLG